MPKRATTSMAQTLLDDINLMRSHRDAAIAYGDLELSAVYDAMLREASSTPHANAIIQQAGGVSGYPRP